MHVILIFFSNCAALYQLNVQFIMKLYSIVRNFCILHSFVSFNRICLRKQCMWNERQIKMFFFSFLNFHKSSAIIRTTLFAMLRQSNIRIHLQTIVLLLERMKNLKRKKLKSNLYVKKRRYAIYIHFGSARYITNNQGLKLNHTKELIFRASKFPFPSFVFFHAIEHSGM